MQENLMAPGIQRQAACSRALLIMAIGLTALVLVAAQWVDLAALLRISPGFTGHYLRSENANWVNWAVECFAGPATLFAMSRIAHMLQCLRAGQVFTAAVIADIRSFALWILIATLVSVVAPFIIPPVVERIWQVELMGVTQVSGSDLLLILVSAMFFQIARLLDAARRMADDYEQIV